MQLVLKFTNGIRRFLYSQNASFQQSRRQLADTFKLIVGSSADTKFSCAYMILITHEK